MEQRDNDIIFRIWKILIIFVFTILNKPTTNKIDTNILSQVKPNSKYLNLLNLFYGGILDFCHNKGKTFIKQIILK